MYVSSASSLSRYRVTNSFAVVCQGRNDDSDHQQRQYSENQRARYNLANQRIRTVGKSHIQVVFILLFADSKLLSTLVGDSFVQERGRAVTTTRLLCDGGGGG